MADGPFIAETAALIGDPARANMLSALMGGQALTAGELAYVARVAPSTASQHLAKLLEGRLLTVLLQGRHRYYRLASEQVARALEGLMALDRDAPPRYRPRSVRDEALARARTCYDHLAGKLGVAIADALSARAYVVLSDDGGVVTDAGHRFLIGAGLYPRTAGETKRPVCRPCVDWSERCFHLGGTLGAAIAARSFEQGWIVRQKDGRAVDVTAAGVQAFGELGVMISW